MAISSAARSGSICVSRSNIRDWRIRQIIYFQSKIADPGQDHDAMAGLHHAIMVAIIHGSCRDHAGIMPKPVHSCRICFAGIDGYRQQKKNIDIEPETERMVCHADIEQVRKKKISSRTRSRNRAEEGQEGIPGYPHKESADHHPYNPPRKRYSPPLLLFYSLSQKFFLTKNSCSIITYTEVRDDK